MSIKFHSSFFHIISQNIMLYINKSRDPQKFFLTAKINLSADLQLNYS
jgi:hypothetical protein